MSDCVYLCDDDHLGSSLLLKWSFFRLIKAVNDSFPCSATQQFNDFQDDK